MLGVKSHSLWEVVVTGRAWRTSDVLFISWSGCWKHGCVRSVGILPDLHYIMLYALFCMCCISKVYLPLSKSSLSLSSRNKCWTNMCRIIVWRAARLQHASRSIDVLVWPGHSDVHFHLMEFMSLLFYDLAFLFRAKASLAYYFSWMTSPSSLCTKGSSRAIALLQISLLVRVAWLCQVLMLSWRW